MQPGRNLIGSGEGKNTAYRKGSTGSVVGSVLEPGSAWKCSSET